MLRNKVMGGPALNLLVGLCIGFLIAVVFDVGRYGRNPASDKPMRSISMLDDDSAHLPPTGHHHHDPHNEDELEKDDNVPAEPMHFHANQSAAHHGRAYRRF